MKRVVLVCVFIAILNQFQLFAYASQAAYLPRLVDKVELKYPGIALEYEAFLFFLFNLS